MTLFSVVLGIVATALLLPKDVEDRTLYTILAKPVPRIDYLAGKLLGVLLLVFVSLALMDVLMSAVLQIRTSMILSQQLDFAQGRGWSAAEIASLRGDILSQGPNGSLQGAVFAVFLRASIMASLALLISTFSSSTLFTSIISFLIYFIGHFQADARDAYLQGGQAGEQLGRHLGDDRIRWIDEDQVGRRTVGGRGHRGDVCLQDMYASRFAPHAFGDRRQVAAQMLHNLRILLHKGPGTRAAAQGLQPIGAAAGKQIQETAPGHPGGNAREYGLAHGVRRRPDRVPFRQGQRDPASLPPRHPHARTLPKCTVPPRRSSCSVFNGTDSVVRG